MKVSNTPVSSLVSSLFGLELKQRQQLVRLTIGVLLSRCQLEPLPRILCSYMFKSVASFGRWDVTRNLPFPLVALSVYTSRFPSFVFSNSIIVASESPPICDFVQQTLIDRDNILIFPTHLFVVPLVFNHFYTAAL